MKSIHISLLGHLTLIGALLSAGLSHGRTGDRKLAMQHLAAIDAQYTDPGTPLEAAQRGMCRGFGQTEALKGTWVCPHKQSACLGLPEVTLDNPLRSSTPQKLSMGIHMVSLSGRKLIQTVPHAALGTSPGSLIQGPHHCIKVSGFRQGF